MNVKDFLYFGIVAFGLGGIAWGSLLWFAETFEAYMLFVPFLLYGLLATAVLLAIVAVAGVALTSAFYAIRAIFKKESVID